MNYDRSSQIRMARQRLSGWLEKNGLVSHDVCDVRAHPVFLRAKQWAGRGLPWSAIGKPITYGEARCRNYLRKPLRIRPMSHPQSGALLARGYLTLGRYHNDQYCKDKARYYLDYVLENAIDVGEAAAWGQPYDWPSRILIPANTPRATVTSIALMAFLDAWELLREDRWASAAKMAALFFAEEMPRKNYEDGTLCFHYTTIDNFTVHNANLLAAAALARAGTIFEKSEWVDLAIRSARFTVLDQKADGSWNYHYPQNPPSKVDHYHTGFVLEALMDIKALSGKTFPFDRELEKGITFYRHAMFDGPVPKMTPTALYPIDVQSCAQAIITLSTSSYYNKDDAKLASDVTAWTIRNFQNDDGSFQYRHYRRRIDRTRYVRWGQSWMLRALAKAEEKLDIER